MKLLTNENVAQSVVNKLISLGYDVLDIKTNKLQGITDTKIVNIALQENRVVITHDRDYIELTKPLSDHPSVIIILPGNQPSKQITDRLVIQ